MKKLLSVLLVGFLVLVVAKLTGLVVLPALAVSGYLSVLALVAVLVKNYKFAAVCVILAIVHLFI